MRLFTISIATLIFGLSACGTIDEGPSDETSDTAIADDTLRDNQESNIADALLEESPEHVITQQSLSSILTPTSFPATLNPQKKARMLELDSIGSGQYVKIGAYYNDLSEVYADFELDPNDVMLCDDRHEALLTGGGLWSTNARNYFCLAQYDTAACHTNQFKKVFLSYCLDENDTLDWVALQSALLRADGRTVVIPANSEYIINQPLVLPSNSRVVWGAEGTTTTDGRIWKRPNASFITFRQLTLPSHQGPEPVDNFRGVGFSSGSVVVAGDMPFIYSGSPSRKPGAVRNITLYHPHINAGNYAGENALSFAQGVSKIRVYGGVLKNVKINAKNRDSDKNIVPYFNVAGAGGKAIQCEAGCVDLIIEGIKIIDSHIGFNSSAIQRFEDLGLNNLETETSRVSDLTVLGSYVKRVDIPVRAYNDMDDKSNSQRVIFDKDSSTDGDPIGSGYIRKGLMVSDSGRMTDAVYLERAKEPRHVETSSSYPTSATSIAYQRLPMSYMGGKCWDTGVFVSYGAYLMSIKHATLENPSSHAGVRHPFHCGWGTYVSMTHSSHLTRTVE